MSKTDANKRLDMERETNTAAKCIKTTKNDGLEFLATNVPAVTCALLLIFLIVYFFLNSALPRIQMCTYCTAAAMLRSLLPDE